MLGITFTAGSGALFITTMTSLISKQAGPTEQGLVMGVYQSGSWMGRSVAPVASGALFDIGANLPLFIAAIIMAPCLVILAAVLRRVRAQAEE